VKRSLIFPTGVRLWHFIVLPGLAMALAILLSRAAGPLVLPHLEPWAAELYEVVRLVAISALMSSVIAWLAFRHRRDYEAQLRLRQQALEATRDFLSGIIEGSAEAIVTLDAEGRILTWNRAAEEIYGWKAEELIGQHVHRLLPGPEAIEEFERGIRRLRQGHTIRDLETTRVRKDGRRITVRIVRSPLRDAAGEFAGSVAIVRDVTEVKRMEALLVERERLAAVGEMSAQVAHEVKNPLAGIRGACEVLCDSYPRGHPYRRLAEETVQQVSRLGRLVDELLRFARPKPMAVVPTDLHQVVRTVLAWLREDPRAATVEFECDFAPDLPALGIDPEQMQQVFFNLLLNALQAMEYRGRLTVTTRRVDSAAVVTVRDTGPGVAAELRERIFKPFFTTYSKGTGLGLAIVKNVVEAHRGQITVDGPPGGGAEFRITLPIQGA
jgi:two-component system, sporulation sensor kinase E